MSKSELGVIVLCAVALFIALLPILANPVMR